MVKKAVATKFRNGTNKHSEKTKRILAEFNRQKAKNPEYLKRLSKALKGKGLGGHLSEETKRKISESNRGKKRTEETCRRISQANVGKHLSKETIDKMRRTRQERGLNVHTTEWKQKVAERVRVHHSNPKYRKSVSEQHLGRIRVNKDGIVREILQEDLQKYLDSGWTRGLGRPSERKGKVWVYTLNPHIKKCINEEELEDYLQKGYKRGTGPQARGNGHKGMKIPRRKKEN